jgi:2-oxoglutarate dehydrogenase E2 component (dihydrolipoamide succinyltransferase)
MSKVDMVMPQMGESIAEGTIIRWLKKEGESVERDEIILEISTDKVDSEIPSPEAGVITKLLANEGDVVEVGKVIAQIDQDGGADEAPSTPKAEKQAETPPGQKAGPAPAGAKEAPDSDDAHSGNGEARSARSGTKFFSPLVRSIARAEGISVKELERIDGTGASGRVTKKDLLAYIESRSDAPASGPAPAPSMPTVTAPPSTPAFTPPATPISSDERVEIIPMDTMRRSIAEHMVKSVHTSPHVFSITEADLTNLVRYREVHKDEFRQKIGVKLTYMPFIIQATVKALLDFPLVNSSVDGSNIIRKKYVNMGMAVSLENNGLIVPVIKNADSLNVVGLARAVSDLANRARTKKLRPDEVQDGTFSITNLGSFGTLLGLPIINQPQVAILGIGTLQKRPVVINDAIAIRDMIYLSLSFDHRIVDGALAGQFLERIAWYLTNFDTNQIM